MKIALFSTTKNQLLLRAAVVRTATTTTTTTKPYLLTASNISLLAPGRQCAATNYFSRTLLTAAAASSRPQLQLKEVVAGGVSARGDCLRHLQRRSFSSSNEDDGGSHDDFAPKKKAVVDGVDAAIEMIKDHVKDNKVMLYMKGNPSMPMCGFSAQVVKVLQNEGVDFASVNVLDYPSIREGVKKYSDWPTIPQLYVYGEFVGGCDIVMSMHESGELKELLKKEEQSS